MSETRKHVYILLCDLQLGGIQRCFVRLAEAMHEAGIRVTVLTCLDEGPLAQTLSPEIPIVVLKNAVAARKSIWKLAQHLRRDKPDALLSGDVATNICALIAKRVAGVRTRTVIGVHTSLKMRFSQSDEGTQAKLVRLFYRWADRIIAVSQGTRQEMSEFTGIPETSVEVIPNPVIGPELKAKASEAWTNRPFEGSSDPLIIAAGRMHVAKDYPNLLQAFKLLLSKRAANLVIYGEGDERPILEKLVKELELEDRVAMPGAISNPYPAIKGADALAMSSLYEGLPTVLIEAMFLGVPIVSTNCTWGPSEILEDGKWGRLVPVQNPSALADALVATLAEGRQDLPDSRWGRYTVEASLNNYLHVLFD
jgi:glycosyltransferase involved in cell wall biosynthesis